MTWLIHVANAAYLASYAVEDIRWLRWLTIAGILLLIPYYLAYALYAAASWNALFLVLNLLRLLNTGSRATPVDRCDRDAESPSRMCSRRHVMPIVTAAPGWPEGASYRCPARSTFPPVRC